MMGTLGWAVAVAVAVAAFIAAFVLAELVMRGLAPKLRPLTPWDNWEVHHKVAAIDALSSDGGASVVAVGSSTVNAGVDPDQLTGELGRARPAFNAALNGAGIRLLELWTLHLVVPTLRPDVVVIGLGSGELNTNNLVGRRLLDAMVRSPAWRARAPRRSSARVLLTRLRTASLVWRYRKLLGRRALFTPDQFQRATMCRRLGLLRFFLVFRYRRYQIEDKQREIWRDALNDYAIGDEEIASLHRLISGLRAAGVTPLIVRTPFAPDWVGMHPHGIADVERFDSVLSSVSAMDGVEFADLATAFSSLDDYADPVHVNGKGQERLTGLLAAELARMPAGTSTATGGG